ncbi:MAG: DUF4266 domain-containing protein [Rhodoferax sp.]|nr:DUF4266 domain-containing protein [Rhodoferax sp.]
MKKPILILALLPWLGGCADLGLVHAWEKGNLAQPGMSLNADPLEQRYLQHIYTSKEAASGGGSVGGGGCGCN